MGLDCGYNFKVNDSIGSHPIDGGGWGGEWREGGHSGAKSHVLNSHAWMGSLNHMYYNYVNLFQSKISSERTC